MTLPLSYWAAIAFCVLLGLLCRRWSGVALYGATAAFCDVFRALVAGLPSETAIIFADSVLFVLPTVPLARACGTEEIDSVAYLVLVPLLIVVGEVAGSDVRASTMIAVVAGIQGWSAVVGFHGEMRSADRSLSRWAATCIASIGLLGVGFADTWNDVAWTGVAAHAFACVAYLLDEHRK